ncbi:hypothetical protein [Hymenobacter sp.]|jgi:hypothetical protein|uniref:hypothetical protein n=1 Tax=Hymenobacter sp. TaxID=1898978 RepID=UPI002EDA18EC
MPEEIILTESYGSVLVDSQVPCVIVQFHSFANRTEFKNIMETGLAYYAAHSQSLRPWGWIGDVRNMGAIPQAVQDWLTTDWNVRAFTAGVREVSIVVAENVLGQLATQMYVKNTQARQDQYAIRSAYYSSLEEAKQGAREALRR